MTLTSLLAAMFWMCTAMSTSTGKMYTASMPTDAEAKVAALGDCKKGGEPVCLIVRCELVSTKVDTE